MPEIVDSYVESNKDSAYNCYGNYWKTVGQSFNGNGDILTSVKFYVSKIGSPTGTYCAKLYAHSGTFGTSSVGTESPLATSDTRDVSEISDSQYQLFEFTFSTPYTLVANTKYVIGLSYDGGNSSNYLLVGQDSTSPAHAGNQCSLYYNGTWYAHNFYDVIFYIYGNPSTATGTLALIIKKQLAAITGAVTGPQYTASLALTIKKQLVSITGVSTVPQFVASLALNVKKQLASIAGISTVPQFIADLALAIKKQLVSIAGLNTIPQYTASLVLAVKKQLISITGVSNAPVFFYNASLALSINKQSINIEGVTMSRDTRYAKEAWESLEYVWKSGVPIMPFDSHR
jgi:hypothetical protein